MTTQTRMTVKRVEKRNLLRGKKKNEELMMEVMITECKLIKL